MRKADCSNIIPFGEIERQSKVGRQSDTERRLGEAAATHRALWSLSRDYWSLRSENPLNCRP